MVNHSVLLPEVHTLNCDIDLPTSLHPGLACSIIDIASDAPNLLKLQVRKHSLD